MKHRKPKGPQPSRKNARPDEDRLERLNELRAGWGKAPLKATAIRADSCEVEIAREERKLGTALRMRGAAAWGLRAATFKPMPDIPEDVQRRVAARVP